MARHELEHDSRDVAREPAKSVPAPKRAKVVDRVDMYPDDRGLAGRYFTLPDRSPVPAGEKPHMRDDNPELWIGSDE